VMMMAMTPSVKASSREALMKEIPD
jgi:hypothetical protein